jgi:acetyl/propionyl-CoA carboxylase alpha subunit
MIATACSGCEAGRTNVKILIANRGEIAVRIARTARDMGITSVAIYSDADRNALHVRRCDEAIHIGPSDAASSYLSIPRIVEAAIRTGATHVHPGYGFLAENAAFARAVEQAGLCWVGPHSDAIERMGSKIEARNLAVAAGVPVIPGFHASQDPAELAAAAERIGYPVMLKASAGGGGKGIRVAMSPGDFKPCLRDAREESARAFGDDAMFVERFVERPRHIEVQVVGDRHGAVIQLGTRECSVQRRHQKLIEEAPALGISDETRSALHTAAVTLASAIGYDNAGTVEFIIDAQTGAFYFLEMNTRLQVEHTVTELVTGIDLVEWQLRIAGGEALPISQQEVRLRGHAVEARLNAEDAWNGFAPQTGRIRAITKPRSVRWDSGIDAGSEVSPHYDSMLAKLIASGSDREQARRHLVAALDELLVAGLQTNQGFLRWLLTHPAIVSGTVTTRFVDEEPPPKPAAIARVARLAALGTLAAADRERARDHSPWLALGPARFTPHRASRSVCFDHLEERIEIAVAGADGNYQVDGESGWSVKLAGDALEVEQSGMTARYPIFIGDDRVYLTFEGSGYEFRLVAREERWSAGSDRDSSAAGALLAPFPGLVTSVEVAVGDEVHEGDVIVVLEAMKMLHSLSAGGHGTVEAVHVEAGTTVESGAALVTFASETDPS